MGTILGEKFNHHPGIRIFGDEYAMLMAGEKDLPIVAGFYLKWPIELGPIPTEQDILDWTP